VLHDTIYHPIHKRNQRPIPLDSFSDQKKENYYKTISVP
jgi:hypothetical protein